MGQVTKEQVEDIMNEYSYLWEQVRSSRADVRAGALDMIASKATDGAIGFELKEALDEAKDTIKTLTFVSVYTIQLEYDVGMQTDVPDDEIVESIAKYLDGLLEKREQAIQTIANKN